MSRWFVDSFYYIALLNPRDQYHTAAIKFATRLTGHTTTTEAVLLEVANTLAATPLREKAAELIRTERLSADLAVVPWTASLLDRALELYLHRRDKEWGLTDCMSFIVMDDEGLVDALTADHHFEQAGFRAVFAR